MKDNRDPQTLGERLLGVAKAARESFEFWRRAPLSRVYDGHVQHFEIPDYDEGGLMSNDPARHHSRTSQARPVESDGGE